MTKRFYLIVRVADRSARLTTRYPTLRGDEVAYRLNVIFPELLGTVRPDDLNVIVPDNLPAPEVAGEPITNERHTHEHQPAS